MQRTAVLLVFFFLQMVCFTYCRAQTDSAGAGRQKQPSLFSMAAGVQYGFIFAHSQAVQNTKGARPAGAELILSWQRNDAAVWDLCNCYPRKGLLLAYYDYDKVLLGKSLTAAFFLEPVYRLRPNLFFSFKGAFGYSFLNNPYDSIRNPANQSYSTHGNTYIMLGLGLWMRLNDRWWINPSAMYQHISNGGFRQPNKGINWPTAGISVNYNYATRPFYRGRRSMKKFWKDDPLRWDAGIFGIARRTLDAEGSSRRVPLAGLSLQASRQVGRISALTLGWEIYRDEELKIRLHRDSVEASPVKSGLLAGHEFLLGRILFSQRIGVYVFDKSPYYDRLYHRWGLQYRLTDHLGFGLNLQAHRQVADFADLRFVYTF